MTENTSSSDAAFISSLEGFELLPHILRLVARGEPVSLTELAASANESQAEVERVLKSQAGTDWDEQGCLLGMGLTLRPTSHRLILAGKTLYAWCATDTLYVPMMLGEPAVVESMCPATSQRIRVELEPNAVVSAVPGEAVVSQRHRVELLADVRAQTCDHGHFFSSPTAASTWAAEHPEGEVLSVVDAFERCRVTCEELGWLAPEVTRR